MLSKLSFIMEGDYDTEIRFICCLPSFPKNFRLCILSCNAVTSTVNVS